VFNVRWARRIKQAPERGTIAHLSALRKTGERDTSPPRVYPMRSEAEDIRKPPRKESSHFSARRRSKRWAREIMSKLIKPQASA